MGKIVSRIRQARLDYQQKTGRIVSIQEVATAIGISRAALSNIELDKTEPSHAVLAKLCSFYGVPVGALLEYVDDRLALRPACSSELATGRRARVREAAGRSQLPARFVCDYTVRGRWGATGVSL